MSKHWNPQGARRRRQRRSIGGREIAVAAGLFFCAVYALPVSSYEPAVFAADGPPAGPADPWAESRRSRAILEAQEGPPPSLGGETYAAPGTAHVIDGDTFRLGGETIRIADIDTPEMDGRCAAESALARRAKARLETLLTGGDIALAPGGDGRDKDRYGRKLRIVSSGGTSVGRQLVDEGLARPWTGRRMPWCA